MLMENTEFYKPNFMGESSKFGAIKHIEPGTVYANR